MKADTPTADRLVRFQHFITREQHDFLRELAFKKRISGGLAVRRGLVLYAKTHGIILPEEP